MGKQGRGIPQEDGNKDFVTLPVRKKEKPMTRREKARAKKLARQRKR